MKKCTLELLLIFFVILSVAHCQRWNNGRASAVKKPWKNNNHYPDETNSRGQPEVSASTKSHQVRRGGIGAWGYVAIALFVILSGLGIYYTIIFYPIVCKKQRMYHVMGSTTV